MTRRYFTPRGWLHGAVAEKAIKSDAALPVLSSLRACTAVEITEVSDRGQVSSSIRIAGRVDAQSRPRLAAFAAGPDSFAGLKLDRPLIMGIVNVTPDSFSDGGEHATTDSAIAHGQTLLAQGADILDIGGESTRPGAQPVDPDTEIGRVIPVIRSLAGAGAMISVDTRHAKTMAAAIDAGARIVNDVTGLADPAAREIVAKTGVSAIVMHMQGEPRTMQLDPVYAWAPGDIFDFLKARAENCVEAGIGKSRIAIDPGIGFGQNDRHIGQVLDHIAMYHEIGCPIVLGASRKAFIGRWSAGEPTNSRLAGSIAAALHGLENGVQILRVHDAAQTRQALAVADRMADPGDAKSG